MNTLAHWNESRHLDKRVQMLKAVAHPVRLCVIAALAERPRHVNALAEGLDVPQPIVSQQLRILRMMGLVRTHRQGGLAVYELAEPHLLDLMDCLDRCCAGAAHPPRRQKRETS
jgi:ArsR family transcriptional regulator